MFVCVLTTGRLYCHFVSFSVAIGRFLLSLFGLLNAPEIYTAAVGLYVVWTLTRIILFVVPYAFQGLSSLTAQLLSWMVILLKCVVAGIILFIIIPLGMGFLADMLIFCPLRVPVNKTPVFYPTTVSQTHTHIHIHTHKSMR